MGAFLLKKYKITKAQSPVICYNMIRIDRGEMHMSTEKIKRPKGKILFLTGAGLSKESGIPTFRDAAEEGMWEKFSIDDVCNISTFRKNYHMVHAFYNERRVALKDVHPNAGHQFIADLQKQFSTDKVIHISTNVDDLAERAGGTVMHVHGKLTEIIEPWTMADYEVRDIGYTVHHASNELISKPNVVLFGESYRYEDGVRKPLYEDMYKVLDTLTPDDVVIVIGSSDTVVKWSMMVGKCGALTINVNLYEHDMDHLFNINLYDSIINVIPELKQHISDHLGVIL